MNTENTTRVLPPLSSSPTSKMEPSTRVILWTAPRCLSSVFERSIRELIKVKVFFEPHLGAFRYGPERKNSYDLDDTLLQKFSLHTYDHIEQILLADYEGFDAVFAKDMTYFVPQERYSRFIEGEFSNFKHTFLIRNPQKSVPSRWRACNRSGFDFVKEASSFSRLYELYELVSSKGGKTTIIDADDLLENPEYFMEYYCLETGLPYHRKMLTWSPGVVEDWAEFKHYKDWHWKAMHSSGFERTTAKESFSAESFPSSVLQEIQEAMPYYEAMYKKRHKQIST